MGHLASVNAQALDRFDGTQAESATVHDASTANGSVAYGEDVRVRPSAVVFQGISLGDNLEVGANATVSNAVILPDATIEDGAVVKDCIVGESATVGAYSTVEGGNADVVVDGELYEDIRVGGVVGDNAHVGGAVTVVPGSVLGNESRAESGAVVDSRIKDGAIGWRGH